MIILMNILKELQNSVLFKSISMDYLDILLSKNISIINEFSSFRNNYEITTEIVEESVETTAVSSEPTSIIISEIIAIYAITVRTEFLENAKRAEYFKLTDHAVPTIDFTMPDEEYA
ncbi:hypothetical protein LY90DRAFT_515495 [Neocallimastix californiae]|uniref:Uncharacterized protein n=1 Tax=Neocallimastix californiae TaxID=1754190 RepID=A0A1Y2AIT1_9FUNG|nr:hypothetical protein LY90DRAFT_515495 [Neocallimastix californiae]|eukprot:ORY22471.1 hypothetical protein LY90DRAFT_515495 [Neocallimastix californiae]